MPQVIKTKRQVERVVREEVEEEVITLTKAEAKLLGAVWGANWANAGVTYWNDWPKARKLLAEIDALSGRQCFEGYHTSNCRTVEL